jgi:putative membrane protein
MLKKIFSNTFFLFSFLLIIIYCVGITGLIFAPELFKAITPFNLLLSVFFVLYFDKSIKLNLIAYLLIVFCAGWCIEWLGVRTGLLFGTYSYGTTLGFRIDNIPVLIGLNWFILSYCSANIVRSFFYSDNIIVQSLCSGILMVLMDACIEPVCEKLDFWYWQNHVAPFQNYIAWFVFSSLFSYLFFKLKLDSNNSASRLLYLVQVFFFLSLLIRYSFYA